MKAHSYMYAHAYTAIMCQQNGVRRLYTVLDTFQRRNYISSYSVFVLLLLLLYAVFCFCFLSEKEAK